MKKFKQLNVLLILIFIFSIFTTAFSQKGYEFPDTIKVKRNVIKWNLTPFLLWSTKNINISYERVLKPYRSFSVNAGYFELPSLINKGTLDSLQINNSNKKGGFSVSGDYRFYFKKRNKKGAPDGLYWGVYGSYHHYQFESSMQFIDDPSISGAFTTQGHLNVFAAGVELGYQFIIKERLAIDLIFIGPAISLYNTGMTLDADVEVDDEDEYLQAIYDILSGTIPGFDELVGTGSVDNNGASLSLGPSMRYMIQIGYRF